jgi:hypothetical protein
LTPENGEIRRDSHRPARDRTTGRAEAAVIVGHMLRWSFPHRGGSNLITVPADNRFGQALHAATASQRSTPSPTRDEAVILLEGASLGFWGFVAGRRAGLTGRRRTIPGHTERDALAWSSVDTQHGIGVEDSGQGREVTVAGRGEEGVDDASLLRSGDHSALPCC